ncbi:hypothetical protein AcW2_005494 [Taiwanofungus camphoratus]|nr:hypothetical protein AcW2_005494 [Antrodia cinnamomea]
MPSSHSTATLTADSEELARFREQWKEEVRKKKSQSSTPHAAEPGSPAPILPPKSNASPIRSSTTSHTAVTRPSNDVVAVLQKPPTDPASAPLSRTLSRAVEVYRRAVECEQQSNLDEALQLYRTAFRMDSNVDRAYHRVELQMQYATAHTPNGSESQKPRHHKTTSVSSAGVVDEITRGVKELEVARPDMPIAQTGNTTVTGTLASLLASWPRELVFEPEDEKEATPLKRLPDELLVLILRSLDPAALERFAIVNRKARVAYIRDLVQATYKPPQIREDNDIDSLLHGYMTDYRRLYIEHPRVRLDGVYIAVCHYIRRGLSENAWVNVNHLITYHRYLRFYPNGQVLSLLANEELPPQQVISVLKPTLRTKGLFIGNWYLDGTTVYITELLDPSGGPLRYAFRMTLKLRSRPLGRWNRLDFHAYESVEIESGEATPVALKHERPFWFSKVRSYA